jgi:hypothetical protein
MLLEVHHHHLTDRQLKIQKLNTVSQEHKSQFQLVNMLAWLFDQAHPQF